MPANGARAIQRETPALLGLQSDLARACFQPPRRASQCAVCVIELKRYDFADQQRPWLEVPESQRHALEKRREKTEGYH
jgi:hypothetical protein